MNAEEYRSAALDVAYLAACAVNGKTPEGSRVRAMDLPALYRAAERHMLTGIAAMALESAGVKDEAFTQAKGKAIRKAAAFDVERSAVFTQMEKAGIWYMPLKGAVLKELYPRIGMRQMSDNDILYDGLRTPELKAVMESLGFTTDSRFGRGIHDHYFKPPVCNFEMHRALFGAGHDEKLTAYYRDVKSRLIPNKGSACGYHFSDEDFYVYMLAHAYKHYSGSGTGLRSVLDTYVYLVKKGETLDQPYIAGELGKLGITDYEMKNRSLALHLFGGEPLTAQDQEMLDYILSSGTYGNAENRARNLIGKKGRVGYLVARAFLPLRSMRTLYPVLDRWPILLPACWVLRLLSAWKSKRKTVLLQFKAAFRH